ANFFSRIGWRAITVGLVAYFVILPVSSLVPSLTAVTSALGTLLVLGFWIQLYGAGTERKKLPILVMSLFLPLLTLTTCGFIGYGTNWALGIVTFSFVIARRRILYWLAAPAVGFLGLSLFVTYSPVRDDIREVVWDESTGIA